MNKNAQKGYALDGYTDFIEFIIELLCFLKGTKLINERSLKVWNL